MSRAILTLTIALLACSSYATEPTGIPFAVDFIAQKPDYATATKVNYTSGWAACCNAATASTRVFSFNWGLRPVKYLRFLVVWTPGSATAQVRLRAYRYVLNPNTRFSGLRSRKSWDRS